MGTTSIVKCRTYDVSISYDKYYRVPRVWLRGYDENGNPLSSTQIFEDISADHAHKTVTVEPHVHSGVVCASIHPCRHSEVMKRFMTKFEESGKRIAVDDFVSVPQVHECRDPDDSVWLHPVGGLQVRRRRVS